MYFQYKMDRAVKQFAFFLLKYFRSMKKLLYHLMITWSNKKINKVGDSFMKKKRLFNLTWSFMKVHRPAAQIKWASGQNIHGLLFSWKIYSNNEKQSLTITLIPPHLTGKMFFFSDMFNANAPTCTFSKKLHCWIFSESLGNHPEESEVCCA